MNSYRRSLLLAALAVALPAGAQTGKWPEKPVRIRTRVPDVMQRLGRDDLILAELLGRRGMAR